MLSVASAADASTFTVINTSDSGVSNDGSLRGEVIAANTNPGADTVNFASGLAGTITLSGAGIQITDALDLEGPGPAQITVAQSSAQRVIHVNLATPGAVTIAGLHIANGQATSGPGGDIFNDTSTSVANLTVSNALVTGGTASDYGGGIDSSLSPLTLRSSTVSGNSAISGGGVWVGGTGTSFSIDHTTISGNSAVQTAAGGLLVEAGPGGSGVIDSSTISGNRAATGGGGAGVFPSSTATVAIRNSTVFGNTATNGGGGGLEIGSSAPGNIKVQDSTVAGNQAGGASPFGVGGGIYSQSSNAPSLEDTIVATNGATTAGPDVSGALSSAFSLIQNTSGATISETVPGSDLTGVDPQLGPLASNGGPTQTMALALTSPAIDKGSAFGLTVDQRGDKRPIDFPAFANSKAAGADGSDIGAFELQPAAGHIRFKKLRRNKHKGTATQTIKLPKPDAGTVVLTGKHLKRSHKKATASGKLSLKLLPKGKLRRLLRLNGHAKVKVKFTYTPQGGKAVKVSKRIKLIRN